MSAETEDSKIQADLAARRKMEREKQELLERARLIREEQMRQAELEKEERAKRLEKEMELQKEEERKRRELEYQRRIQEQKRLEEEEAMARRIAIEERKIVIAQRKLESIRLLTVLFEQIRLSKMGDERERRMLEELLEARKKVEREKAEEELRRLEAEQMEKEKREQEDALQQMLMRKLTRRETPPPPERNAPATATKFRRRSGSSSGTSSGEGEAELSDRSGSKPDGGAISGIGRGVRGRGFTGLRRVGGSSRMTTRGVYGFGRQASSSDKERIILTAHNFVAKTGMSEKGPVDPRLPFARRQQYVPMALRKLLGSNPDQARLLDVSGPEGAALLAKAAAAMGKSGGKKGGSVVKSKQQKGRHDGGKYSRQDKTQRPKKKKKERSRSSSTASSRSRSSSSSDRSSRSSSSKSSSSSSKSRSYSSASSTSRSRSSTRSPSREKPKKKLVRPARSRSVSPAIVQSKKAKRAEPMKPMFGGKDKKVFSLSRKEPSSKVMRGPEKRQRFMYRSPERSPQSRSEFKKPFAYEDNQMGFVSGSKLKRVDVKVKERRYFPPEQPVMSDKGHRHIRDFEPPTANIFPGRSLSSRAPAKATSSKFVDKRGATSLSKVQSHHRRDLPESKAKSSSLMMKGGDSPPHPSQPISKRRLGRGIVASTSGGGGKSGAQRSSEEPRYTFFSHTR